VLNGIFAAAAGGAPPSTLGIIPLGSANDFASGLGLPQRLDQVLARLVCGKRRRCDVGLVQSHGRPARYFAFSLGLGALGAAAAERRQVRLLRGRLLYLYAAARARPLRATPQIIRVRYDAQPIQEQRISFLSVNNVGSVGGFDFAPQAKLDDGLLDIVLFRGASFRRRLRLLSLMCIGRHRPARDFQFARTARLEVWSGGQLPLHLDGEPYGASFQAPAALRISVMPQALKVIV
jgi:diacylglycerol kinase family enzyme